jgi:hypothetical protein
MNLGEFTDQLGKLPHRKRLPGAVYVFREDGAELEEPLQSALAHVMKKVLPGQWRVTPPAV